jgi:histidyl-tRNA synthetase
VAEELRSKGIDEDAINRINAYLSISGTNAERLQQLQSLLGSNDEVKAGIESLTWLLERIDQSPTVTIDFTLARGLNYYTGCIFEVKAPAGVQMGSIGGGGRYDDLTGLFGVKGIPGVGISFGIDRIYEVMDSLDLFPTNLQVGTQLLFLHMGEKESMACQSLMKTLRDSNLACELYPDAVKMDKQFKYADKKQIPFVAIIGSREMENQTCMIKEMRSGEQTTLNWSDLLTFFNK